jgi:hypothetical protein
MLTPVTSLHTININMQNWQPYVRAGWEIVVEAQGASQTFLEPDIEAFLVHTIARTMERTDIWKEPIAIKILSAQALPGIKRKPIMREIGEECLFIDGWGIKQPRWPNPKYFANMGEIAFGMASTSSNPADELLELVSTNFVRMSSVLKQAKTLFLLKN